MKFELLPNEIIIECFEYLNIFDIFYSFDQLNNRFSKLIRNIPLHINFENVRRKKFVEFCRQISSNSNLKQQIYSLRLSNKDTCGQIRSFLSHFSSNDLFYLHSLTLIQIEQENLSQLKSLLPSSSSQLYSFHLISSQIDEDEILSVLSISNLRKLSLTTLRSFLIHIQQSTLITHLTISNCSLQQLLYKLFQYVPLLKYLNIEYMSKYNRSIKNDTIINAIHLKKLIIGKFNYKFEDFVDLAKQTPNLRSLTISSHGDIIMINAVQWKKLIISSLCYLNTFKFKFTIDRKYTRITILCFKQFQNDFWIKKHNWYTHLLVDMHLLYIYTIPYLSNNFNIESAMKRITRGFVNNSNIFDNVTNLTLIRERITDKCLFRFPNVSSLKLLDSIQQPNEILLKMIVNLSNLKHLDISMYQKGILSGELLIILIESIQLSSMTIDSNDLKLLFNDKELCKYLNIRIKKLNLYKHGQISFDNLNELKKFCRIFSNIEQIICNINQPKHILFLMYRLLKLSTLHVYLSALENRQYFISLFQKTLPKLYFVFHMKETLNAPELFIWIDKNIN